MPKVSERVWWVNTIPTHVTTAGYTQVLSCVECGATVTVTSEDVGAAEVHIKWHEQQEQK